MDKRQITEHRMFFAGLFAVAWADRALQPSEQGLLRALIDEASLPDDLRQTVEGWFQRPPGIDEFDGSFLPAERQSLLLRTALRVAKADQITRPSELRALQALKARLTLDAAVIQAIEAEEPIEPDDA